METNYAIKKWLSDGKFLFTVLLIASANFSNGQTVADFEMNSRLCCGSDLSNLVITNKSTVDTGDLTYKWSYTYTNGTDIGDDSLYCDSSYLVKLVATSSIRGSDSLTKSLRIEEKVDSDFTFEVNGRTVEFNGPSEEDLYRWTFGDGSRDQVQNPTYTYVNRDGPYTVCLAVKTGDCWSQTCKEVFKPFGSVGSLSSLSVSMHPNPVQNELLVSLNNGKQIESVQVVDLLGQIVYSRELISLRNDVTLDLAELNEGTYLVRVYSEGLAGVRRVVVSR